MNIKKNIENKKSESSCCGSYQAPCCGSTPTSCCGPSESIDPKDSLNQESSTSMTKEEKSTEKLKVDIYIPLETCSCEWVQFMNLIFSTLTPYMRHIKHETKSLNSEEAGALNLTSNCVIIDGKHKYTTSYELKKDLPSFLKEKGLL